MVAQQRWPAVKASPGFKSRPGTTGKDSVYLATAVRPLLKISYKCLHERQYSTVPVCQRIR